MNKYIVLLIIVSISFSCKDKTVQKTDAENNVAPDADLSELYQYYHSNPQTLEQREENQIIEYAADNNLSAVRTRSGIYIARHVAGDGDSVKWGDPLTVDYRGYFLDGKAFDSSYKRGKPISFRVGSMVPGWNEAFPFLKVGSTATFIIPSHMGYGKRGFPGFVEPDQILVFDVEILTDRNKND
ncbi:MAG: FKBP-type peptidyl-prolyl cis-trans isomerase [Bacteroidota bacterium]